MGVLAMIADLEDGLVSAGYRPTRQRRAVFNSLVALDNHPTAEEVFTAVRHELPHISLATVYKALESLTVAGLASKLGCCEGSTRYDARMDGHYHARCRCCGAVADVDEDRVVAAALGAVHPPLATTERFRLEFVGVCEPCQLRGPNRLTSLLH
jgi:Fe2+ or Zn2+ uptake regulation protein